MSHPVCTVISLSLRLFKRESFLTWAGFERVEMHMGIQMSLWDSGWSSFGSHGHSSLLCLLIFVCGSLHCFPQPLLHFISPHYLSVFCACISLLFSDIGNILSGCSYALVEEILSSSIIFNCVLCFPWWSLGDPYTCWKWISCLNAQGLMMLAKGKDRTRLPKDRLLNWQCREDWKDTWKKIKKVDAHHVQKQTQVGWNLTATNKQTKMEA